MKKHFFRILIIDDSNAMRYLLRQIIDRNDITPYVEDAPNGIIGIEKFIQFKPDLVILDLRMPDIDGLDVLKKMQELNPSSYVIVISSSTAKIDTQDAMKYGACDYIVKPFDRNEIAFKIIKALREKARNDQMKEYITSLNSTIK
ncbi:MAG: response regulator [Crenarchaeota archaeon]|nr:MAG: response regulator [Thermoproteota archaeon]RDJ33797.1 MAG: response regulator [Thermoproteota archaeon]RDJ37094.1 MAG: response regulator [Thermoproteota archaeon]RDJ37372.1 MAG: response regulator [Thermoproteota archaeon]